VVAAKRLLRWYDRARRPLPWRRDRDPYRVWISEVMLQQTRADVVAPYFERFLARFPSVAALAAAPHDAVLAAWSGLGYYRRAEHLHRAAREIVRAGSFPSSRAALLALPGVGEYTAAAVASIAFGEAVAVLDGNAERVSARIGVVRGDPKRAATRRGLLAVATGLLDRSRPGDSNQALMELGATICLPAVPRCPRCPLRADCGARAEGAPERYPTPRRRAPPRRVEAVAAVVRGTGGRVLLVRRGDDEPLLAATWEVPWVELEPPTDAAAARALARRYGGRWRLGAACGAVRHTITRRALRVAVRPATLERAAGVAEGGEARYFRSDEIGELPRAALTDKILALARSTETAPRRRARRRRRPRGCASR
jgi:A/G-specific adenine glycosylase